MWRSKWMMPMRFEVHVGDAAHAGKADRMVAAQHDRQRARRGDMADAPGDLVEALFEIGRDGEDVAGVAQRHLLAQVDAELVVVGRVERRDAADALRPEAGAGPVGGAAVEGDADDRRVVFADVADVLDIGRLQEGVDAGEMRQLAAREGRDRLVGRCESEPGRPMSSAHCCSLRQPSSGSFPSASIAFQPCVSRASKSGWWRRCRRLADDETGAAVAAFGDISRAFKVSLATPSSHRRFSAGPSRPSRPPWPRLAKKPGSCGRASGRR